MVGAHLLVLDAEDGGSLAEIDEALFFQDGELPLDEGVVVRIGLSSDEGSPPVDGSAESCQVRGGEGREILRPVDGVSEFWDIGLRDFHLFHDIVLKLLLLLDFLGLGLFVFVLLFLLSGTLLDLLLRLLNGLLALDFFLGGLYFYGEIGRVSELLEFVLELVSSCADGHSGAVEPERE